MPLESDDVDINRLLPSQQAHPVRNSELGASIRSDFLGDCRDDATLCCWLKGLLKLERLKGYVVVGDNFGEVTTVTFASEATFVRVVRVFFCCSLGLLVGHLPSLPAHPCAAQFRIRMLLFLLFLQKAAL